MRGVLIALAGVLAAAFIRGVQSQGVGCSLKHFAANKSDAAAKSLNGGCDLDDGNSFYQPKANGGNGALPAAIAASWVQASRIGSWGAGTP